MIENDNIKTDNKATTDFDTMTNTKAGTSEQGALKSIHRGYNKLNGFESMLHTINRFRAVLYPFILLSILGSAYSFYNDYVESFPMMHTYTQIAIALFFSVCLELVRDGAMIALFNAKMKLTSRLLVIFIFFGVTTYLFNTHIKTKDVIESKAISYSKLNTTAEDIGLKFPEYKIAKSNLNRALNDLNTTNTEYSKQLDISANARYKVNKENAQKQLPILKSEKQKLESKIETYQNKIIFFTDKSNGNIEDKQQVISSILLTTLILIEALAMLGGVIKYIHKDNADKEVSRHNEIIEDYSNMSEQMNANNDKLGLMLAKDIKQQGEQSVAVMNMIAENKMMMQQQLTMIMQNMNNLNNFNPTSNLGSPQPTNEMGFKPPVQQPQQQPQQQPKALNESELIKRLYDNQSFNYPKSKKLTPKKDVININNRSETELLTNVYKKLLELNIIELKGNKGYYAIVDYQTAIEMLDSPITVKDGVEIADYNGTKIYIIGNYFTALRHGSVWQFYDKAKQYQNGKVLNISGVDMGSKLQTVEEFKTAVNELKYDFNLGSF